MSDKEKWVESKGYTGGALSEGEWEVIHRVGSMRKVVLANSHRGSKLAKSFAVFHAAVNRDLNTDAQYRAMADAALAAWAAWGRLAGKERQFVLGGWDVSLDYPSIGAWCNVIRNCSEYVERGLTISVGADSASGSYASLYEVGEASLHPIRIIIREGTPKDTVVAALIDALSQVERNWLKMVATELDQTSHFEARRAVAG